MRSGKDTIAARLVAQFQYTRGAFADPLRVMAYGQNPIITADGIGVKRLASVVDDFGWERAKEEFPEVRRTLQEIGQGVRTLDPDFWIRILLEKVDNAEKWNLPLVVTDVRYRNEADALKARGFRLVRVTRPGNSSAEGPLSHLSERDLDRYTPDAMVYNGGSLAELHQRADALAS
jgi:hypothetical protein